MNAWYLVQHGRWLPALLGVSLWCVACGPSDGVADQPLAVPNIVVILADDLGYSDLGCYGGEIETPNLDQLAEQGLRYTQFYNTARCWPTRAALLTGYYAQQVRRDVIPDVPRTGSRGTRPVWAKLLPEMLKPLGYRTYHSGKWHVDGMPTQNGFDRSYYVQDQDRFFSPRVHYLDDQKLPVPEPDSGYYATTAIADHAVQCLQDHAQQTATEPFFQYVAFTSPHFPLQALQQDIAKYHQTYRRDWAEVRQDRYTRQRQLGLLDCELSDVERDIGPPYHNPQWLEALGSSEVNRPLPWRILTDAQRDFQSRKMAIHAAMVDRMDQEIGRIISQLRNMHALDNTLLFFLSDNGASAEIMVRGDGHDPAESFGSWQTYLCLGPGWSTTSNTPFRRHKTWVHEGGVSTPLIVHWPARISAAGALRTAPGHVIDIVPTVLEVTGAVWPPSAAADSQPVLPGMSLVGTFASDQAVQRELLWWFHDGHRALRVGNWKLVADRSGAWELYDLGTDRAESHNLATAQVQRVQQLAHVWQHQLDQCRQWATAASSAE